MSKTDFSKFTGLYEINKTLRFELRPVGDTINKLEKDGIIEEDRIVEDNYNKIKVFFDSLHREFVKQSLEKSTLNLSADLETGELLLSMFY